MTFQCEYDVIVVGAGHAGIEAALAAARMGQRTACVTMRSDRIGHLPCNCSIGGPAKGHMAREVDALGGQMGVTADLAMTHLRRVGTSRGPAVQTVRAHVCKTLYPQVMQQVFRNTENLTVIEALVNHVTSEGGSASGVCLNDGRELRARAVVLTTGTFLNGLCHEGSKKTSAARHGDAPSVDLSTWLRDLGVRMRRFKTGTTPRIKFSSINFDLSEEMPSEPEAGPISFLHDRLQTERPLFPCWQVHTNQTTHDLITENLHQSAMYSGQIEGVGPRYCPSIEDKVVRFADKDAHPVFFEREEWDSESVYVQGMSTSLPAEVQLAFLKTIPALKDVEMIRPGYAVEYDMADPQQLTTHLMSKLLPGLFLAGQVNGTSGYEEAAGQGIVAGINAARFAQCEPPIDFLRDNSFIGVMVDDLVTKGVDDPYRMLTARAEHRLLLRHDNSDQRLTPIGREAGLVTDMRWARFEAKVEGIVRGQAALENTFVSPADADAFNDYQLPIPKERISLYDLMRRPEVSLEMAEELAARNGVDLALSTRMDVRTQLELNAHYAGYLTKELKLAGQNRRLEDLKIPEFLNYEDLGGISYESREKFARLRPGTIGQASRIPGVRPTDVALLIGHLRRS